MISKKQTSYEEVKVLASYPVNGNFSLNSPDFWNSPEIQELERGYKSVRFALEIDMHGQPSKLEVRSKHAARMSDDSIEKIVELVDAAVIPRFSPAVVGEED